MGQAVVSPIFIFFPLTVMIPEQTPLAAMDVPHLVRTHQASPGVTVTLLPFRNTGEICPWSWFFSSRVQRSEFCFVLSVRKLGTHTAKALPTRMCLLPVMLHTLSTALGISFPLGSSQKAQSYSHLRVPVSLNRTLSCPLNLIFSSKQNHKPRMKG